LTQLSKKELYDEYSQLRGSVLHTSWVGALKVSTFMETWKIIIIGLEGRRWDTTRHNCILSYLLC